AQAGLRAAQDLRPRLLRVLSRRRRLPGSRPADEDDLHADRDGIRGRFGRDSLKKRAFRRPDIDAPAPCWHPLRPHTRSAPMSLDIPIELGDDDRKHFIDAMKTAQLEAKNLSAKEITDAAEKLLEDGSSGKVPGFIAERLSKIDSMIAMVNDEGFGMEADDRQRVLACLTYFANPKDLIPDNVPVLGFLDDAIMIELVVRELQHEVE